MKNNLGRPKIGKEVEKSEFLSTRVAQAEALPAGALALKAGQSKSEWLRDVVKYEIEGPPIWVKSHWKKEELNGQFIRFELHSPTTVNVQGTIHPGIRELAGIGELAVRKNAKGEIAIDIFVREFPSYGEGVLTRIWLAKSVVDKIELNTDPDAEKIKFKVVSKL